MILLDGSAHAHCCPYCMRHEKEGEPRIAYPCDSCETEREMMELKVCEKHQLRLVVSND